MNHSQIVVCMAIIVKKSSDFVGVLVGVQEDGWM